MTRPLLLKDVEQAVRDSWGADTCTPVHRPHWSADNPARDQCGVTAMVVNDLLGGELVRGEVHVDGERVDYHWWNRFATGVEIDLTREQFAPHESVTDGVVIPRPPAAEWRRLREEYEILRDRVMDRLGRPRGATDL
ncbi:hypothetical protein ABT160_05580 [Streptomyces sp. NPDC001941]|uniref:YunG family protein n=1 Tax=Streptomyces sp. NPDC001941 TaxID=3154659 RepID=UPI003332C04D